MPLRLATLDDPAYKEFLVEALSRIPVHTPEWTNVRESDPGIVLVTLLAFLSEELEANERRRRRRRRVLAVAVASAAVVAWRLGRDDADGGDE